MTETHPVEVVSVRQDARNRALRTFAQNLAIDIVVAVVVVLFPIVSGADSLENIEWRVIGFSLLRTVVVTTLAYLMRVLRISPATATPSEEQPSEESP